MAITTPPTLTPPPSAPSRNDPANFAARGDAMMSWFAQAWTDLTNALANVAANATDAFNSATSASANAASASTNAAIAQSSAQTAVNAPGTQATSTTSATIGTGNVALTIQPGKSLAVGAWVLAAATTGNFVHGQIVSYDSVGGALVIAATTTGGAGTFTSWTVSLSAPLQSLTPGLSAADMLRAKRRSTLAFVSQ